MVDFSQERRAMVRHQLEQQGVRDPRVLEAMERIPRHAYLDEESWDRAYRPQAVDIESGQTMSQPYMVAVMTEALELTGRERVLEVGTGSGYQAAVLAYLTEEVVSIERIEGLARRAARTLEEQGLRNVQVLHGDGSDAEGVVGDFDRILVTAAAPHLSRSLLERLRDPGILVCPVGDRDLQVLTKVIREDGEDRIEHGCACRFVPLLGERGFETG